MTKDKYGGESQLHRIIVMTTFKRSATELFIVATLLTACTGKTISTSSATKINSFTYTFLPLDSENIGKLEEVSSWNIMNAPISLLKYNNPSNNLIAVSEENKKIVKLDVQTGKTTSYDIENVSNFRAIGFDAKGEKLLGAGLRVDLKNLGGVKGGIDWLALWDVNSGLQLECVIGFCSDSASLELNLTGSSADLDNGIIVDFSEGGYSINADKYSGGALINSPDADYQWRIGNIAIDSHNKRLAIVYQEGRIELTAIKPYDIGNFSIIGPALEKGDKGQLQPVHAALFDRTGKWLAIVRGEQLSIWDVDGWFKKVVYLENVGVIHGIGFSPSSKFLFLATDDKIKIINLDKNKLEAELDSPNITSLDISEDNRLLFWGDKNGTIHLYGVLKTR